MAQPIIEVSGISKRFRLGQLGATSFREEAELLWNRLIRRKTSIDAVSAIAGDQGPLGEYHSQARVSKAAQNFWALRDVSFEVQPGEIVGIVGQNGAGKSTLLKVLSRITEPTRGEAVMRGRIGSLLEVGTGFHPDLSGRENIFLNGAILGMRKAEVDRKFDEIVAFAEVEKFIDTPVKRYSSGMYVRLAFAVAAHLEPEILIVDEVLAVGDVNFQRKCLGKMHEISSGHGRTILFVSHNMNAVEKLCTRCICLKGGEKVADGTNVHEITRRYLADGETNVAAVWRNDGSLHRNEWFRPDKLAITDPTGDAILQPLPNSEGLDVLIEGEVLKPDPALQIGYGLFSSDGELLFWSTLRDGPEKQWVPLPKGTIRLTSRIPARFLNEGQYRLDLFLGLHHRHWICEPGVNAPGVHFQIQGGLSDSPFWVERRPGMLGPVLPWSVARTEGRCEKLQALACAHP